MSLAKTQKAEDTKQLEFKENDTETDSSSEDENKDDSSSSQSSERDLEQEEKELEVKDSSSEEELPDLDFTETSELEKKKAKRKYDFTESWKEMTAKPESVYVDPLTYFECEDPKSNPLLNVSFVDRYGSKIKSDFVLKNKEVIALLFSDSTSVRGHNLINELKKIHIKAGELKKPFEVVYISFDTNKENMMYDLRLNHGNWFAIDFDDPTRETLKYMYGILALPQLIAIDLYGDTITRTGVNEVELVGINVLVSWF